MFSLFVFSELSTGSLLLLLGPYYLFLLFVCKGVSAEDLGWGKGVSAEGAVLG